MALILEVRGVQGVVVRRPLEALPVTIGRALTNDIVLDDPYVDATHARIAADESGGIAIEDLGSVNGVHFGGSRAMGKVAIQAGWEVRVGRTVLRFRETNEVLPPALVESRRPSFAVPRVTSNGRDIAVVIAMLVGVALNDWMGNTDALSGGSAFAATLGAGAVGLLWALGWAVAARGQDRRLQMLAHLRVFSLAVLVMVAYSVVNEWLTFLFPEATIVSGLYLIVFLGVIIAAVAYHLAVSHSMSRRARWQSGFIAAGTVLVLFTAAAIVEDEEFSDVARFPSELKPMPATLTPTTTLPDFLAAIQKAKDKVDSAAAK